MPDDRELLSVKPIEDREEELSPVGYLDVALSPEDRQKLEAWVYLHLQQIESEMAETLARFEQERNQLEGIMPGADHPYAGAFRVNHPVTKKKAREVTNRIKQAYLDSDPIWTVGGGNVPEELAQQLERSLDDLVDHKLNMLDDLAQAIFECGLHGAGFLEPGWCYLEGVKRDVVAYQPFDGLTMQSLQGLFQFEQDFPDWQEDKKARKLHNMLARGIAVEREVSYQTALKNQPEFRHIETRNMRAYPSVNGWEGLLTTPLYGHLRTYTRFELEQFAQQGTIDEDQLGRVWSSPPTDDPNARLETQSFDILHATIQYALSDDQRPARYKIWYERKSRAILRIRGYPWWLGLPDLVVFYIRQEHPGFFKPGLAWDLKDDHVVLNILLSMYLNSVDMANSMRWRVKWGSLAEQYLLAGRWSPKLPVPWKENPNEVESLVTPTHHIDHVLRGFEMMRRQTDEQTQTTSLQSGRDLPTDPSAPGIKVALLLQQVEPNTKEYIRSMEPGFRVLGKWILWLYYQGLRLGWIDQIPGVEQLPIEQLPMLAEQLNPRAFLFETDRANRVERNFLALKTIAAYAPKALPEALKIALSQLDSQWSRLSQRLDLTPIEAQANVAQTGGEGLERLTEGSPGSAAGPLAQLRQSAGSLTGAINGR